MKKLFTFLIVSVMAFSSVVSVFAETPIPFCGETLNIPDGWAVKDSYNDKYCSLFRVENPVKHVTIEVKADDNSYKGNNPKQK